VALPIKRLLDQRNWLEWLINLQQKPAVAYAIALGGVALAASLRYALKGVLMESAPFITLYPAILIAPLIGGFWPGTVAMLASVLTGWYLFVPPAFSFALDMQQGVNLMLFVLTASFIVVVVSLLHGALEHLLVARERQEMLTHELRHRLQNLFAVIQTLATRTLEGSATPAQARENFNGRLMVLSRAHALLALGDWQSAFLAEIVRQELSGFAGQTTVNGCEIVINASAAQTFALIIHELATNAVKYGALSSPDGSVIVEGRTKTNGGQQFKFRWKEVNGPPVVTPTRTGFGSTILLMVAKQFSKDVRLDFEPDGLVYELQFDLGAIAPAGEKEVLGTGALTSKAWC
jgi:two-component sensor histidine kinase